MLGNSFLRFLSKYVQFYGSQYDWQCCTSLTDACKTNDVGKIILLTKLLRYNVNEPDLCNQKPLYVAYKNDNYDVVKWLLVHCDCEQNDVEYILRKSCDHHNYELAKFILRQVRFKFKGWFLIDLFKLAVEYDYSDMIVLLLKNEAVSTFVSSHEDIIQTLVTKISNKSSLKLISLIVTQQLIDDKISCSKLLKSENRPNVSNYYRAKIFDWLTKNTRLNSALLTSPEICQLYFLKMCTKGDLNLVKLMLSKECVSVETCSVNGVGPLEVALKNKNPHIFKWLWENQYSNLDDLSKHQIGVKLLTKACRFKHMEIIDFFMANKIINLNYIFNEDESTVFMHIFRVSNLEIRSKFLTKAEQLDVNISDTQGNTILHKVMDGSTRLHKLINANRITEEQIIQEVEEHKNEISCQDEDGNTPLHLACLRNNAVFCRYLLISICVENEYYDLEIRNNNNETPMIIAQNNNYQHIINMINYYCIQARNIAKQMKKIKSIAFFFSISIIMKKIRMIIWLREREELEERRRQGERDVEIDFLRPLAIDSSLPYNKTEVSLVNMLNFDAEKMLLDCYLNIYLIQVCT